MKTRIEQRGENALTVAELIEMLEGHDPDLKVWADGCDCTNPVTWTGVSTDPARLILEVAL